MTKLSLFGRREADETFYKLLMILGVKYRRMSTELYSPGLKLIELFLPLPPKCWD